MRTRLSSMVNIEQNVINPQGQNRTACRSRISAKKTSNIFASMQSACSKLSLNSFNQFQNLHMEKQRTNKNIAERSSEDSADNKSIGLNSDDEATGYTRKQLQAIEKLSVYQKGWKRMNRELNRTTYDDQLGFRTSLLDQQMNYVSPRSDCLSSFYETAQHTASVCTNDLKKKEMIAENHRIEGQKFDLDIARKSWVGSLRNDKNMFLQTTKNSRNELFCHISSASKDFAPYSTRSILDYRCRSDEEEDFGKGEFNQDKLPSNRMTQTAANLKTAADFDMQN